MRKRRDDQQGGGSDGRGCDRHHPPELARYRALYRRALDVEDHADILRRRLKGGDGTFGGGVRPDVELRRLEAVQRQDRADLRAVVAPVVRELSERHPELQIHLAPLVVDLLIEVDLLRLEELLDRVANARETRCDLIDRRGELDER